VQKFVTRGLTERMIETGVEVGYGLENMWAGQPCGGSTEAWGSLSTLSKQVHPFIMRTIRAAVHRLPGFHEIEVRLRLANVR